MEVSHAQHQQHMQLNIHSSLTLYSTWPLSPFLLPSRLPLSRNSLLYFPLLPFFPPSSFLSCDPLYLSFFSSSLSLIPLSPIFLVPHFPVFSFFPSFLSFPSPSFLSYPAGFITGPAASRFFHYNTSGEMCVSSAYEK